MAWTRTLRFRLQDHVDVLDIIFTEKPHFSFSLLFPAHILCVAFFFFFFNGIFLAFNLIGYPNAHGRSEKQRQWQQQVRFDWFAISSLFQLLLVFLLSTFVQCPVEIRATNVPMTFSQIMSIHICTCIWANEWMNGCWCPALDGKTLRRVSRTVSKLPQAEEKAPADAPPPADAPHPPAGAGTPPRRTILSVGSLHPPLRAGLYITFTHVSNITVYNHNIYIYMH